MGRNVYISFLGTGAYQETRYVWGDREANPTPYVQKAELSILESEDFDAVYILATKDAERCHYEKLTEALPATIKSRTRVVTIDEDMSREGQWKWFEQLLDIVEPEDALTIDLTLGFRSMPLVVVTALNFLRRARDVRIQHLLYGVLQQRGAAPAARPASPEPAAQNPVDAPAERPSSIVDLAEFLAVNEWAEGVAALVDNIDARKLAEVARNARSFHAPVLQRKSLLEALDRFSRHLHNVEVNKVRDAARAAVEELARAGNEASSPVERVLVEILFNKVRDLAGHDQLSHHYDRDYFDNQLEIAQTLFAHGLYMQGFTVLRELIGSIGMIREKNRLDNADDRKHRYRAELFVRIVQYVPFEPQNAEDRLNYEEMKPFAEEIESCGAMKVLRGSIATLLDIRNGFDHAWTRVKPGRFDVVSEAGKVIAACREALDLIDGANLWTLKAPAAAEAAEE